MASSGRTGTDVRPNGNRYDPMIDYITYDRYIVTETETFYGFFFLYDGPDG